MPTNTTRQRFEEKFPRKRWVTTLTVGGIHQLQEDVIAWHEQEIATARRGGAVELQKGFNDYAIANAKSEYAQSAIILVRNFISQL